MRLTGEFTSREHTRLLEP